MKKTVFISGASGALGSKLVSVFLKKNFNVICTINKIKLKDFKKNFKFFKNKKIQKLKIYKVNFNNRDDLKKIISDINKNNIQIDIMINNAASAYGSTIEMMPLAKLKEIFEVNFFSHILLIQGFLRFLKRSNYPSIINIGSISGLMGEKGFLAYGASKASLMYSTKVLANELSKYQIRVNSIAPNVFLSDMSNKMDIKLKNKFIENSFLKKLISIQNIIDLILFLVTKKSKSINGQKNKIDGGMIF